MFSYTITKVITLTSYITISFFSFFFVSIKCSLWPYSLLKTPTENNNTIGPLDLDIGLLNNIMSVCLCLYFFFQVDYAFEHWARFPIKKWLSSEKFIEVNVCISSPLGSTWLQLISRDITNRHIKSTFFINHADLFLGLKVVHHVNFWQQQKKIKTNSKKSWKSQFKMTFLVISMIMWKNYIRFSQL